tara:strand:+ start:976 stop:2043 length:1068 start_codon:yes stop_codon:yes gene_type:complete
VAYQNVGTPRFYVDELQWLKAVGLADRGLIANDSQQVTGNKDSIIGLTNNEITTWDLTSDYIQFYLPNINDPTLNLSRILLAESQYIAILGHNMHDALGFELYEGSQSWYGKFPVQENIINYSDSGGDGSLEYNGFSIARIINPSADEVRYNFSFRVLGATGNYKIRTISLGNIYNMPHSPELKLSVSRDMDGVKHIRTRGGVDLTKRQFTKPASWGDAGAWELYSGSAANQKLSRVGRRTWDLSFKYLQDSDVSAPTEALLPKLWDDSVYEYPDGFYDVDYNFLSHKRFLHHNDFYTQVIHKTQGGRLPFIFQPNANDNSPQGYAICKFDMSKYQLKQVANGVYNVKLKIREVW